MPEAQSEQESLPATSQAQPLLEEEELLLLLELEEEEDSPPEEELEEEELLLEEEEPTQGSGSQLTPVGESQQEAREQFTKP